MSLDSSTCRVGCGEPDSSKGGNGKPSFSSGVVIPCEVLDSMGLINITPEVDGDLFLLESLPRLHRGDLHSSSSTPSSLRASKSESERAEDGALAEARTGFCRRRGIFLLLSASVDSESYHHHRRGVVGMKKTKPIDDSDCWPET